MQQSDYFVKTLSPERDQIKKIKRDELISLGNTIEDEIKFLLSVSFDLTPLGFECFVAYFLSTHYKYETTVQWGFYDRCIDIKGVRQKADGTPEYMIAQCKQWNTYSIGLTQVVSFYGQVADIRYEYPAIELYYATVGKFTWQAKSFMDEKGIIYLDFTHLLKISEYVNREGFMKYLSEHAQKIALSTRDRDQMRLFIDTNRDVYALLKKVRAALARDHAVPAYVIARDQQLREICKLRPRSLNDLVGIGWLKIHQVEKYGPEFIKALVKMPN